MRDLLRPAIIVSSTKTNRYVQVRLAQRDRYSHPLVPVFARVNSLFNSGYYDSEVGRSIG
jgi:hypothetical protein